MATKIDMLAHNCDSDDLKAVKGLTRILNYLNLPNNSITFIRRKRDKYGNRYPVYTHTKIKKK